MKQSVLSDASIAKANKAAALLREIRTKEESVVVLIRKTEKELYKAWSSLGNMSSKRHSLPETKADALGQNNRNGGVRSVRSQHQRLGLFDGKESSTSSATIVMRPSLVALKGGLKRLKSILADIQQRARSLEELLYKVVPALADRRGLMTGLLQGNKAFPLILVQTAPLRFTLFHFRPFRVSRDNHNNGGKEKSFSGNDVPIIPQLYQQVGEFSRRCVTVGLREGSVPRPVIDALYILIARLVLYGSPRFASSSSSSSPAAASAVSPSLLSPDAGRSARNIDGSSNPVSTQTSKVDQAKRVEPVEHTSSSNIHILLIEDYLPTSSLSATTSSWNESGSIGGPTLSTEEVGSSASPFGTPDTVMAREAPLTMPPVIEEGSDVASSSATTEKKDSESVISVGAASEVSSSTTALPDKVAALDKDGAGRVAEVSKTEERPVVVMGRAASSDGDSHSGEDDSSFEYDEDDEYDNDEDASFGVRGGTATPLRVQRKRRRRVTDKTVLKAEEARVEAEARIGRLEDKNPVALRIGKKWMEKRRKEIRSNNKKYEMTVGMMLGIKTTVLKHSLSSSLSNVGKTESTAQGSQSNVSFVSEASDAGDASVKKPKPPQGDEKKGQDGKAKQPQPALVLQPSSSTVIDWTKPPLDSDFSSEFLLKFPPEGSDSTPPHPIRKFEFKDYGGPIFARLRRLAGIDEDEYLHSLASDLPYLDFISNAKSGMFFFYTYDRKFMIKSQRKEESKYFRSIFKQYYQHVHDHPHSLLTRVFGMHRVRIHRKKIHFMIMRNVFPGPGKQVHMRYDLKGSTFGREATARERMQLCPVLKDNDFKDVTLKLGTYKNAFMERLRSDVDFLKKLRIMDYSLLVGIRYSAVEKEREEQRRQLREKRMYDGGSEAGDERSTVESLPALASRGGAPRSLPITSPSVESNLSAISDKKARSAFSTVGGGGERTGQIEEEKKGDDDHDGEGEGESKRTEPEVEKQQSSTGNAQTSQGRHVRGSYERATSLPVLPSIQEVSGMRSEGSTFSLAPIRERSSKRHVPSLSYGLAEHEKPALRSRHLDERVRAFLKSLSHTGYHPKGNHRRSTSSEESKTPQKKEKATTRRSLSMGATLQRRFSHPNSAEYHRAHNFLLPLRESGGDESPLSLDAVPETGKVEEVEKLKKSEETGGDTNKIKKENMLRSRSRSLHANMRLIDDGAEEGSNVVEEVTSDSPPPIPGMWEKDDLEVNPGEFVSESKNGERGEEIYYMGVIDILQVYNGTKKMENFFKSLVHDGKTISAVDPDTYGKRFLGFLENHIE